MFFAKVLTLLESQYEAFLAAYGFESLAAQVSCGTWEPTW